MKTEIYLFILNNLNKILPNKLKEYLHREVIKQLK